jgi:DNA-binding MarR family transcriptional regulator
MEDAVKALGHLALGTRLKRLGDRLQAQTQAILEASSVSLYASHLPPLVALKRHGAMTIGDLSRTLGVTQPGVTRMTATAEAAGLVRSEVATADRRARVVSLTPAGLELLAHLERRAFPLIEAAVRDACAEASSDFLAHLSILEDTLEATPLATRALRPKKGKT